MLSIYTFEETSLTIGYIPSKSFSSAPSVKIAVDSMKGAGESLVTGWLKMIIAGYGHILGFCVHFQITICTHFSICYGTNKFRVNVKTKM